MPRLVIATRSSPLAVYQANWVRERLLNLAAVRQKYHEVALLKVKSIDYQHKDSFAKPCQEKLLDKQADIAVHSAKDLPVNTRSGLTLAAICERLDAADALVGKTSWSNVSVGANIATTSLRRKTHLLAMRPDLRVMDLRGNIETRLAALNRVDEQKPDALVLAAAGLIRLGYGNLIQHRFTAEEMLPAPGQGAYAIECRQEDRQMIELLAPLNHPLSALCIHTERLFCKHIGADCYGPVAAYADLMGKRIRLRAMVGSAQDGEMLRNEKFQELSLKESALLAGSASNIELDFSLFSAKTDALAQEAANHLLAQGAAKFLTGEVSSVRK